MLIFQWLTLMIIIFVLNLELHYEVLSPSCFIIELVFGSSTSVTILNLFFRCFLDGFRFFKEPGKIVCHDLETFN